MTNLLKTKKRSINNDAQMIEAIKEACDHYYLKNQYAGHIDINSMKQSIISYINKHFELEMT